MKKTVLLLGAVIAVSLSAETTTPLLAPDATASANVEITEAQIDKIRNYFLSNFSTRFQHAAKLYGLPPLSPTEKQHVEAAAAKFFENMVVIARQRNIWPVIVQAFGDPKLAVFTEDLGKTQSMSDFLAVVRKYGDYVRENYPILQREDVCADLRAERMNFSKAIEELPSMPKLAEKSAHTFWSAVLFPGLV